MDKQHSSDRYACRASNAKRLAGSVCYMQLDEIQESRREKLREAIAYLCSGNETEFGRRLGYKNGGFVRQMLAGSKSITEKTVLKIEALPGLSGWFTATDAPNTTPGPRITGRVPLISSVQAGEMTDATDLYAPGYAEEFIATTAPIHRHTYALRIKGDSMEPLIPEGYVVIVEPEADPREGDVVVAKNGDHEANVKLLVKVSGDWWLKPANRDYKPKPLGDAKIIGVVVAAERRFR